MIVCPHTGSCCVRNARSATKLPITVTHFSAMRPSAVKGNDSATSHPSSQCFAARTEGDREVGDVRRLLAQANVRNESKRQSEEKGPHRSLLRACWGMYTKGATKRVATAASQSLPIKNGGAQ